MEMPSSNPYADLENIESAHRKWRDATAAFHRYIREVELGFVVAGSEFDRLYDDLKAKHEEYNKLAKSLIRFG